MKKVINLKEVMIILLSVVLVTISVNVFASDSLFLDTNNTTTIQANEYDDAQTVPDNTVNNPVNNVTNNKVNNTTNNTVKTYNTNNTNNLPQTGIEDYNIGILLIVCIASAIFAYKKINDYRNI